MAALAAVVIAASEPASLDLKISGLRNLKGNILICLTPNAKAYPNCAKDSLATKRIVPATDAASVRFPGVVPGTYAIALIHDENANGRMDAALFVPREGFGFSRNARASFGPPTFAAARFDIAPGSNTQSVTVKYLF